MSIQERELDPEPTADLVTMAAGGASFDRPGFAVAYRDHCPAVTAVARRICGPRYAADVAQEVFALLWSQPDKFDPSRGSLRAFLLALARHKAVDVLRGEHARQAREERVGLREAPMVPEVDHDLLRGDVAAQVQAALSGLAVTEREAITAAFFGGLTYRETAVRLGQPEGTIKSRIRSGLQRLRPALGDLGVEASGTESGLFIADGAVCAEAPSRWFVSPSPAELALLDLAVGPVLDVGCGPGRHVLALSRAGVAAVGIDLSPRVVMLARRRGASVLEGSIFDAVPGAGQWGTCLLLDGNIGIGGRPDALLQRVQGLVRAGGSILVEAAVPGASPRRRDLRLKVDGSDGPSFGWVDVGIDRVHAAAAAAGLTLKRSWCAEGRWFAWLGA